MATIYGLGKRSHGVGSMKRFLLVAFCAALALGCSTVSGEARSDQRRMPNMVLIVADDLSVLDLATYGAGAVAVPTPNIDRLARRGLIFRRGYSTASVCSPSRAALMTGQYQQRHGFEFLTPEGVDSGGAGLASTQRVFAGDLREAGYRTAMIGKWHLGASPDRTPTSRGFDYFFGFLSGETAYVRAGTPGTTSLPAPYVGARSFERRVDWVQVFQDWAGDNREPELVANDQAYLTDELTREAIRFIDNSDPRPYFLYLGHLAPHAPFQALDADLSRFSSMEDPLQRTYASMIHALDRSVGAVLDVIERSPDGDNTIIIFTADNGAATYMGISDCDALAGGKLSYFEGGARVPYIVSWPRRWPRGQSDERVVSHLDIAPTLLSAAGVQTGRSYDGLDLSPMVQPERADEVIHDTLFWRTGSEFAVLAGDWKLLSNTRPGAFPWLFNLSDDPEERSSQTFARREVVADLQRRYEEWNAQMQPPAWPASQTIQVFQCGRISFHEQ